MGRASSWWCRPLFSAPVLDGSSEGWGCRLYLQQRRPRGQGADPHHREGSLDPTGIGKVKRMFPALRKDERQANLRIPTCPC